MAWYKDKQRWHAVVVDGMQQGVRHLGEGWGRAMAEIRNKVSQLGSAVVKVAVASSPQNTCERMLLEQLSRELDDRSTREEYLFSKTPPVARRSVISATPGDRHAM